MVLSGCSTVAKETSLPDETEIPTGGLTPFPSENLPSATVIYIPSKTITSIQPTNTITITPNTPTFVPTQNLKIQSSLSEGSQRNVLFNLLHDDKLCDLPCWFGITPGETSADGVEKQLSALGFTYYKYINSDGSINYYDELVTQGSVYNNFNYSINNNLVDYIGIRVEGYNDPEGFHKHWNFYSPEVLIPTYGPPDRVRIIISKPPIPHNRVRYTLYVFYDNLGIFVIYNGIGLYHYQENEKLYKICPKWAEPTIETFMHLYLQSPKNERPLVLLLNYSIWGSKPLEDATNYDVNKLYTLLSTPGAEVCFESPIDIWKK